MKFKKENVVPTGAVSEKVEPLSSINLNTDGKDHLKKDNSALAQELININRDNQKLKVILASVASNTWLERS